MTLYNREARKGSNRKNKSTRSPTMWPSRCIQDIGPFILQIFCVTVECTSQEITFHNSILPSTSHQCVDLMSVLNRKTRSATSLLNWSGWISWLQCDPARWLIRSCKSATSTIHPGNTVYELCNTDGDEAVYVKSIRGPALPIYFHICSLQVSPIVAL